MTPPARLPTPNFRRGPASTAALGADVTRLAGEAARVLIVADPALTRHGMIGSLEGALDEFGHAYRTHSEIAGEPSERQVAALVNAARDFNTDLVLAIGGSSVLDAGKVTAAIAAAPKNLVTFRPGKQNLPEKRIGLIAVPTTAGTGAEATCVAFLTAEAGVKIGYAGATLMPDLAILDPLLVCSLPRGLTLATGLGALVHGLEAATNRHASTETDAFALEAIRQSVANLGNCVLNPNNVEARQAMLDAASLAGIAMNCAGSAIARAIGFALASLGPIHHGHAVTLGMQASLGWAMEGHEAHFAEAASAFGVGRPDALPAAFARFVASYGFNLHLPPEFANREPGELASRLAAPDLAPLLAATRRAADPADLQFLAERVFEIGRNGAPSR